MGKPNRTALNLHLHLLAVGTLVCALPLAAQATLPPTAPTSVTPSQLPSANPLVTAPTASHGSMEVLWDGHTLQVNANDVGLNDLVRTIATRTGTHLVGSVPEDRVFGTYGPGPLVSVLSELLDGVAVNVVFLDHAGTRPAELTLTARVGGPSAPMPQQTQPVAPQEVADSAYGSAGSPGNPGPPASRFQGGPQIQPGQTYGIDNTANADAPAPSNSSTTPASPNGVKTPEEIFEQLQRLRATAQSSH